MLRAILPPCCGSRDALKGHVAASLDRPFIILFQQDGADEACNRFFIGEDADDVGAPLDLAIEALDRII